jgi:hypothetical protein
MPERHEVNSRGATPPASEGFDLDPESRSRDELHHRIESLIGTVRSFQGRRALRFSRGVAPGY